MASALTTVDLTLTFSPVSDATLDWEADALGVRTSHFVAPYQGDDLLAVIHALDVLQYPNYPIPQNRAQQMHFSFDNDQVRLEVLGLWSNEGRVEAKAPQIVGQVLYQALCEDPIGKEALNTVRDHASANGQPLALHLRFPPDTIELAALPWELLKGSDLTPLLLSRGQQGSCTRHLDLPEAIPPPRKRRGPVRILAILPQQRIPETVRTEEHNALMEAWQPLIDSNQVVLTEVSPATRDELIDVILAGPPPDIVHYYGHGRYTHGQGALLLDGPGGTPSWTGVDRLMALLGGTRLVVLHACQSAAVSDDRDTQNLLTGVAPALSAAGVPMVIGMQLTMRMQAAIRISEVLYTALARGKSVQTAINDARQALYVGEEDQESWYVPVLYIRSRDVDPAYLIRPTRTKHTSFVSKTRRPTLTKRHIAKPEPAAAQADTSNAPPVASKQRLEQRAVGFPAQRTPLIGREADVDTLRTMLRDPYTRLVTLVGPGGIGKTRLAVSSAKRVLAHFRDGIYFIPLATVSEAAKIEPEIAHALGVKEQSGQSLAECIVAHLRDKDILLVLDNLEQVFGAATLIDHLLLSAPELHILVTSREPLYLTGEQLFDLQPLAVPDSQSVSDTLVLAKNPAVALFVYCAHASQQQFKLTESNASIVAEICTRLEGIPLAIELVAAQIKMLPNLKGILVRLDQFVLTATDQARDRPQRQHTMGDTIAWSYSLLSQEERMLLTTLAVFSGGFSVDAVEAVYNIGAENRTLDLLQSLVDKSLVEMSFLDDAFDRRTMLEAILAFARKRLSERIDADMLHQRHAEFFLQLAERAFSSLDGPDQKHWMDQLDDDQDNLREAAHWFLEHAQAVMALRLTGALWRFWYNRGYLSEGINQIDRPLTQVRTEVSQESLDSNRAIKTALARALDGRGSLAQKLGDYNAAIAHYQEGLLLYRQIEDEQEIAHTLYRLGLATMRAGDTKQAQQLLEESLALNKKLQNARGSARAHNNLGMLAYYNGDYGTARQHYTQSLAFLRELKDDMNIAIGLGNIGEIAFLQDDIVEAQRRFTESLIMCGQLDDPEGTAYCLDWLAQIVAKRGDVHHAAQLAGAAEALRTAHHIGQTPADNKALVERIVAARAQEPKDWDAAWAEGLQLSQEQAIALALKLPIS